MILRDDLSRYLAGIYDYNAFEDYCENGLQVEGKDKIETIAFGVSFNMPFFREAIAIKADALIVHHGIFQQGVFKIKGPLRQKIKLLTEQNISLYGVHLPMDAHSKIGHNALLLSAVGVQDVESFETGFMGVNAKKFSLDHILDIYHSSLHTEGSMFEGSGSGNPVFGLSQKYGFMVLRNGPQVPGRIAVISGDASRYYEKAIEKGVDTFFSGSIKEHSPALSLDSETNFVNLGHYYSEKPGVLALKDQIEENFDVKTGYIEISNPI